MSSVTHPWEIPLFGISQFTLTERVREMYGVAFVALGASVLLFGCEVARWCISVWIVPVAAERQPIRLVMRQRAARRIQLRLSRAYD